MLDTVMVLDVHVLFYKLLFLTHNKRDNDHFFYFFFFSSVLVDFHQKIVIKRQVHLYQKSNIVLYEHDLLG